MTNGGQIIGGIGASELIKSLPGAYFVVDPELVVVAASDQALSEMRLSESDLVGKRLLGPASDRWTPARDRTTASLLRTVGRVIETGESDEIETLAVLQGTERAIRWSVSALRDPRGAVVGAIVHAHGGGRARREEERFRLLSSATSDTLWDWDLDSQALWWSDGVAELLGSGRDDLDPTILSWTGAIHPDDADRVRSHIRELIEVGEVWRAEYRLVRADGEVVWVEHRARLMRDADGLGRRVVGGISDITEKRRLDDQQHREQRLESIGVLAGGIAHNLNNILAPIVLAADALADEVGDTQAASTVELIHDSAGRAADLCRDLLSFARGVQGRRELIPPTDLMGGVMRLVTETFPREVRIASTCTASSPIMGDPTQLQQVLLNVCVNARDAMPRGGSLTLDAADVPATDLPEHPLGGLTSVDPAQQVFVRFRVTDTGCGMDQSTLDRLFDPFFTTKEVGRGTGLGLPTSLAIVSSHGGTVHVDSDVDVGTTFDVFLPSERHSDTSP
ncbi:MAG: PAS domain-containing sensor histidine kinase [Acidimicrobiales bacterium]